LLVGSITSWTKFQKYFLEKFAEETTIGALMAEIFTATMIPKEKVKYNQPWLARDSLEIPGWVHNLPRHPEKLLP
jgi:hypothetical protein